MDSDDIERAEESVQLMHVLHTYTLHVSSETNPTCGQILPILQMLEGH